MLATTIKRITHDIDQLKSLDNIDLEVSDNLKVITCYIDGPADTIYEDGRWKVTLEFPDKYPYNSPSIGFVDKIYHPNIDFASGSICLNALNEEWRPIYTVKHILSVFLPQLLTYPNPDDPLNPNAASLYIEDMENFNKTVKLVMEKYNTLKKRGNK